MVYCTYSDINTDSNITSSDIADATITSLIAKATKILNSKINIEVVRERVLYIDDTRENEIDSSNKTYYIRNWFHGYLADSNGDGSVTTADLTVYVVDSDGTETEATISSIDTDAKSFTLETAYDSSYRMYVTYTYAFKNPATPDPLIQLACEYLTISLCYNKINFGRSMEDSFGNRKLKRHLGASAEYWDLAMKIINEEINYKGANLKTIN